MLLTIYDKAGTKRADVAVNDSSTQSKEVQGDNVLSLSFSYSNPTNQVLPQEDRKSVV